MSISDHELTTEQKEILNEVVKLRKPVQRIAGYAGTGKSTLIGKIIKRLPNFAVCAFTGKAASVLRDKDIDASTIHSLIYKPVVDESGNIKKDKYGNPIFARATELPYDGIIVDEASMVNQKLYEDLVSFNLPIIFVGDSGQLEPIGSDINLMANPDFMLRQIHRNAGEIAHFGEWIRNGFKPAAFGSRYKTNQILFIPQHQVDDYAPSVDQMICAFNKTRVAWNARIRYKLGITAPKPVAGDRVMCLKNDKTIGLFNGMQGRIKKILSKYNRMQFDTEDRSFDLLYDPSQFGREKYDLEDHTKDDPHPFDWCYALSCHKSQGSEWDKVLVLEQYCSRWDMRRWLYTAATRAKKILIWAS